MKQITEIFENLTSFCLTISYYIVRLNTINNSIKMRFTAIIIALFAFVSTNLKAQEVTDYDLKNFVLSYFETMHINTEAQNEMLKVIEKEDLSLDAYHAINDSKDTEFVPDLPEEDFEKYEKVYPKILKIQKRLEADVDEIYASHDLDRQKYKAIAERVKLDYLLQNKMEKLMADLRAYYQQ